MANFCSNCGASLTEGTKFCPECGQGVDATSQTTTSGQSANIGGNVGGNMQVAGRDVVHIHESKDQGLMMTCKVCNGVGISTIPCPECHGEGYFPGNLLLAPKSCLRCGGAKNKYFKFGIPEKGKKGRGIGEISESCRPCKGQGKVRI